MGLRPPEGREVSLNGGTSGVTPESVVATSDGGSAALALVDRTSGSWLVKLDTFGAPQWQKEVGCFDLPEGSYSYGVSLQQSSDGGYALGGQDRRRPTGIVPG